MSHLWNGQKEEGKHWRGLGPHSAQPSYRRSRTHLRHQSRQEARNAPGGTPTPNPRPTRTPREVTESVKSRVKKYAGYAIGWIAVVSLVWVVGTIIFMACSAALVKGSTK